MSELMDIFEALCPEIQEKLRPKLKSIILGPFIKGYLPQSWIFKTEKETVTFSVDKKGIATVKEGGVEEPDVTIEIDHEYLVEALKSRSEPEKVPEKNDVEFHTTKGETAYNFLKKELGL